MDLPEVFYSLNYQLLITVLKCYELEQNAIELLVDSQSATSCVKIYTREMEKNYGWFTTRICPGSFTVLHIYMLYLHLFERHKSS